MSSGRRIEPNSGAEGMSRSNVTANLRVSSWPVTPLRIEFIDCWQLFVTKDISKREWLCGNAFEILESYFDDCFDEVQQRESCEGFRISMQLMQNSLKSGQDFFT